MLTKEDIDLLLGAIDTLRKLSYMFGEVSIFDEKSHIEDVLLGIKNGKYEIVDRHVYNEDFCSSAERKEE